MQEEENGRVGSEQQISSIAVI